jgi:hypothetical protein
MLLALGTPGGHPVEGCIVDMSSVGVQVRVPNPVPCDTLVKIEGEHELILGEVRYCEPEKGVFKGAYRVGIHLTSALPSLIELELLNRALIVEAPAEQAESYTGAGEETSRGPQSGTV